ncbi:hypothetical protein [Mesorhizobium sp. M0910]|uniref:ABC transporter permease n=1 Tax=Mesorhizobium sp. M0910 TaxID=2957025 RepID=UPI00333B4387
MAALGLSQSEWRYRNIVFAVLISPLAVPAIVSGVGHFYVFAKLKLVGTFSGLILAHSVLGAPFVVITVYATLKGGGFNRSTQHLLICEDEEVAYGDVTDLVHDGAEGWAVGALEAGAKHLGDLAGAGAEEQDRRPADRGSALGYCSATAAQGDVRAEVGRARRDLPRNCGRSVDPEYCARSWTIPIDDMP